VHLARNVAYGGAAVSLALLAGLAQMNASAAPLRLSVYACSLSLPVWLLLGTMYEYYIFIGERSYAHLASVFMFRLAAWSFGIAGLSMVTAATGLIWFLAPGAAVLFIAISLVGVVLAGLFHFHLADWWFRGPGRASAEGIDAHAGPIGRRRPPNARR